MSHPSPTDTKAATLDPEVERRFNNDFCYKRYDGDDSEGEPIYTDTVRTNVDLTAGLKHFLATEIERAKKQVERDSEKTRPTEETLPEGLKNKIYRIIDSFLVESKNQYGEDRSIDQLNQDRHLAANELLDLFARAVREVREDEKEKCKKLYVEYVDHAEWGVIDDEAAQDFEDFYQREYPHPKGAEHE